MALVLGGAQSWTGYNAYLAVKVHDLEGLRRLVALQELLIARQAVALDAVQAALAGPANAAFANPYTAEPMQYDRASQTLSFEPRATGSWVDNMKKRSGGRIAIRL